MSAIKKPQPDFFLSSREGYGLEQPRACYRIKQLGGRFRDDYLLIRIDPDLLGQQYGLGDRHINLLVIAPRHVGISVSPISQWPIFVHVARLRISEAHISDRIEDADLEEIGWAELHPDLESALRSQRS